MEKIEILGIIATFFVIASFMVKGEWRIRLINSFGATLFIVYGIIIRAWSVWILNLMLLTIHLYFLIKPAKEKTDEDEVPQIGEFNKTGKKGNN